MGGIMLGISEFCYEYKQDDTKEALGWVGDIEVLISRVLARRIVTNIICWHKSTYGKV